VLATDAQGQPIYPNGFEELARKLEHVKAAAARRWVAAVNADGRYGEWRYSIVHDIGSVPPRARFRFRVMRSPGRGARMVGSATGSAP
jgi:hypothetical protein